MTNPHDYLTNFSGIRNKKLQEILEQIASKEFVDQVKCRILLPDSQVKQEAARKFINLLQKLLQLNDVLVAFSGGVDSTFLLYTSLHTLGQENVLAVTADSPIRPGRKIKLIQKISKDMGAEQKIIATEELKRENFIKNSTQRCYFCKLELYEKLTEIAQKQNISHLLDGTNRDDVMAEHRPGLKALKENQINTPLRKAGLQKQEIRKLARIFQLQNWNQPSDTCLATRIDHDLEINRELLESAGYIEEKLLKEFEFTQLRARIHDKNTVRIEVLPEEMDEIMKRRKKVVNTAGKVGFNYVTLGLKGYRSGSMMELSGNRAESISCEEDNLNGCIF